MLVVESNSDSFPSSGLIQCQFFWFSLVLIYSLHQTPNSFYCWQLSHKTTRAQKSHKMSVKRAKTLKNPAEPHTNHSQLKEPIDPNQSLHTRNNHTYSRNYMRGCICEKKLYGKILKDSKICDVFSSLYFKV